MAVKSGIPLRTEQIADPDVKQRKQNLSAQQILNYARTYDKKWAPYVRVVRAKKTIDDFNRTVYRFETITVHPDTPPNRSHYFTVRPADMLYKGPVSRAPSVIIQCDCPRYMFVYEYAMWYRGAGYLERSNKEYPIVTNPSLRPGACKHGLHALTRLIAAGL